ncbi:MAG: lytic transglycosylase domain-containing protein [Acidobacteria bacterium]|nr:lytic transglycosylase domain-containing protein [Acidobacteriota bacterium]
MKKTCLLLLFIVGAIPCFSQSTRPRIFDNFDTVRGVQVYVPTPTAIAVKARKTSGKNANVDQKFNKKTALVTPMKARSITRNMNASEGLADREMASQPSHPLRMSGSSGLKGFTTGDAVVDSYIVDSSRRWDVDPLLIYSQMHQESTFKPRAISNKGASGLMQLMPATARRMGVSNIFDPRQNIEGGVKYMHLLLDMFGGDVNLALAGYNAGEGAVIKYGNTIPPYSETQEYVRRITARYASISDGSFARNYHRVNGSQAARLEKRDSRPLTVYEPNAFAIRLADGRMRLVNQ